MDAKAAGKAQLKEARFRELKKRYKSLDAEMQVQEVECLEKL